METVENCRMTNSKKKRAWSLADLYLHFPSAFILVKCHNYGGTRLVPDSLYTVELQWLKHLWDYKNLFERRVVRAIEDLL